MIPYSISTGLSTGKIKMLKYRFTVNKTAFSLYSRKKSEVTCNKSGI